MDKKVVYRRIRTAARHPVFAANFVKNYASEKLKMKDPAYLARRQREDVLEANLFREIFVGQAYRWLYERITPNTTLLDLGANIGDTAFYFAQNSNVSKIIGYEPQPACFKHSKELLKLSPFSDRIEFRNRAVSASLAEQTISATSMEVSTNFESSRAEGGITVAADPLGKVLQGLRNVAIKCDCEGAEATLFNGVDMSNVYAIQLEQHDCKREVEQALRPKGFKLNSWRTPDGIEYISAHR